MMLPTETRLRLVTLMLVVMCLSQISTLPAAILACTAVFLLALARSESPRGGDFCISKPSLVILFLTQPFTITGRHAFEVGLLTASADGVAQAVIIALKVSASARLGAVLRGLAVPKILVRLFLSTSRYLWLIRDEAWRLQEAMRCRGHSG